MLKKNLEENKNILTDLKLINVCVDFIDSIDTEIDKIENTTKDVLFTGNVKQLMGSIDKIKSLDSILKKITEYQDKATRIKNNLWGYKKFVSLKDTPENRQIMESVLGSGDKKISLIVQNIVTGLIALLNLNEEIHPRKNSELLDLILALGKDTQIRIKTVNNLAKEEADLAESEKSIKTLNSEVANVVQINDEVRTKIEIIKKGIEDAISEINILKEK